MKILKYCILLCAFYFNSNAGNGPANLNSARSDFKKVNATYLNTPDFTMDTQYMVFGEHNSNNLLESKNGKYIRYQGQSYTKIDDIETYAIGDKLICISDADKVISIGDNKQLDFHPIQLDVDSLLTFCKKIEIETVNSSERKYKLYFDEEFTEFTRVDVHIDLKNYRYTRVVLFYEMAINLQNDFYAEEKQPRLEIQYKNFKPLSSEPIIFNQDLYIVADTKGELHPAPKYYNYKLKDLRNQTRIKTAK